MAIHRLPLIRIESLFVFQKQKSQRVRLAFEGHMLSAFRNQSIKNPLTGFHRGLVTLLVWPELPVFVVACILVDVHIRCKFPHHQACCCSDESVYLSDEP